MTTIADDPAASLIDPPKTMAAAVSYLRVSTREQAEKGGTDEGFSIPPSAKRPGVRPNSSAPASSRSSSTREPQPSRPTGPS